jgi:hypothetical protein
MLKGVKQQQLNTGNIFKDNFEYSLNHLFYEKQK